MEQPAIQVDLRHTDGKNAIKAYADVTIATALGEVTVKGFRVVEKEGKKRFVGLPEITYQKNGKPERRPLLQMRDGIQQRLGEAILAEYMQSIEGS